MKFLYPEFKENTHYISGSTGISIEYPDTPMFDTKKDYPYLAGYNDVSMNDIRVAMVRDNVGYQCKWSLVKVIDQTYQSAEYFEKEFYVLKNNLVNIGNKQSYEPLCYEFNSIDKSAIQINPVTRDTFIPYVDRYNGVFSVRIQVSYEKILDMMLFRKVLEEVYYEGVNILLASRGLQSDNETINSLKNKYYTFAYIQNDLDLTARRICEPLTFTVSIPLNFFNQQAALTNNSISKKATKFIKFSNKDFIIKIENIMSILSAREDDLRRETFPANTLENLVIISELEFLRSFSVAANEIFNIAESPLTEDAPLTEYTVGLDDNLNIVSIDILKTVDDGTEEISFNEGLLASARMNGNFANKRIFYYFLNLDNMKDDLYNLTAVEFYTRYVKYPQVSLIEEKVTVDGIEIPPEKVKEFRLTLSKDTDKCLKVSDISNLATSIIDVASDPVFHLFAQNDPRNQFSLQTISQQISKNLQLLNNHFKNAGQPNTDTGSGGIQLFLDDVISKTGEAAKTVGSTVVENVKKDFFADLNSLYYLFGRLDLQEIIFKQIICNLKGLPISSPEVANALSQIPDAVLDYINVFRNTQDIKGAARLILQDAGTRFDVPLFCNESVVYAIKTIIASLRAIRAFEIGAVNFVTQIDALLTTFGTTGQGGKAFNPYDAVIKSASNLLYKTLINILFELAQDLLIPVCDDALYQDSRDNFSDPFNTHIPFGNAQDGDQQNNNKDKLNDNKYKALQTAAPEIIRELQYGVDIEYTVNLIGLLIEDIKCILTPIESVGLLKGEATEEVIVLIRNLIRNKYSKDPNNLSYLLNGNRIEIFFASLGKTVDPEELDPIVTFITVAKPSDICLTPEEERIRQELINNKLPPELDVLADDTRRRVENVRKLIDRLNKGATTYTISGLCPEIDNDDIRSVKKDIVDQYKESIRAMFSNVLVSFTNESNDLLTKFSEEKHLLRKDGEKVFDTYKYNNYYENLGLNLYKKRSNHGPKLKTISDTEQQYKIKYVNAKEDLLDYAQLQDLYTTTLSGDINVANDKCDTGNYEFTANALFEKYLSEGRVLWQNFPLINNFDLHFEELQKKWIDRGNQESVFSYYVRNYMPALYEYMKQKGSVILIFSKPLDTIPPYSPYAAKYTGSDDYKLNKVKNDYAELLRYQKYNTTSLAFLIYDNTLNDFVAPYIGEETGKIDRNVDSDEQINQKLKDSENIRINISNFTGEVMFSMGHALPLGKDSYYEDTTLTSNLQQFYNKNYRNSIISFYSEDFPIILDVGTGIFKESLGTYVIHQDFLKIKDAPEIEFGAQFELVDGVYIPNGYTNTAWTLNWIQEQIVKYISEKQQQYDTAKRLSDSRKELDIEGLFNITQIYNYTSHTASSAINIPIQAGLEKDLKYATYYNLEKYIYKDSLIDFNYKEAMFIFTKQALNTYKTGSDSKSYIKTLNVDISDYNTLNQFFREVYFQDNTGADIGTKISGGIDEAQIAGCIQDSGYSILRRTDYVDPYIDNFSKYNRFDLNNDFRYKNCNIYPHYLNLEYFLQEAGDSVQEKLCDNNLSQSPKDLLTEVLINITIRANVTDLMVKVVPLLSLLDTEEINGIHRDQYFVDIIRENMKQEMHSFTRNFSLNDERDYYFGFVKLVNDFYTREENKSKIINELLLSTSKENNSLIDYLISKEIRRFIRFSLEKQIFSPSKVSIYKKENYDNWDYALSEMDIPITVNTTNVLEKVSNEYLKYEFYDLFIYFIMANTIDFTKRSIFIGTKTSLFRIFCSTVNIVQDQAVYEQKSDEDVLKFITNIFYSPNPSATVYLNPDYARYIDFFVQASIQEAKSILLNTALPVDRPLAITKIVNTGLASASIIAWSMIDRDYRNDMLVNLAIRNKTAALLTYKRFSDGMSPIPDWLLYAGLGTIGAFTAMPPTPAGIGYALIDMYDYWKWWSKASLELDELIKAAIGDQEPCNVVDDVVTDKECEKISGLLLTEINKYE